MTGFDKIPPVLLFFLVITLIGLILIYQVIYQFIIPAIENRKLKSFVGNWAFRSQIFLWCLTIIYFLYRFTLVSPLITLLVVILSVLLGWNFWMDLISGLIFRIEQKVDLGDTLLYKEQEGKIIEIGNRNLVIKTKLNEKVVIPHRAISQNGYSILSKKDQDTSVTLLIDQEKIDDLGGIGVLKNLLVANPWSLPGNQVSIIRLEDGKFQAELKALNPVDREKLKKHVLAELDRVSNIK